MTAQVPAKLPTVSIKDNKNGKRKIKQTSKVDTSKVFKKEGYL